MSSGSTVAAADLGDTATFQLRVLLAKPYGATHGVSLSESRETCGGQRCPNDVAILMGFLSLKRSSEDFSRPEYLPGHPRLLNK
jgi:hypothetical protein